MPVDPKLVELLVCPACHGDIQYKDRRNLIICTKCGLHYPVRENIPIMLIDEATRPSQRGATTYEEP
ncbi:MAG: Trm112 family protein [Egibacteraceae bacterium]